MTASENPSASSCRVDTTPCCRVAKSVSSTSALRCFPLIKGVSSEGHGNHPPRLGDSEQIAGDHPAVDLGGAVADSPEADLAEVGLDRVFFEVAAAAEDLKAAVGDALGHLGGVELRLEGVGADVFATVGAPGGLVDEEAGDVELHRAVGEREGDALAGADRLAPGGALLGPGDRVVEAALGDPELVAGDLQPTVDELLVGERERLTLFAEALGGGGAAAV